MHETTRLLRDLVAIPSVNPMGRPLAGPDYSEHRVTAYLEAFFRDLAVPCEKQVAIAPRRENVVARYEAPGAKRTLLWEVHQDTVPVDNMTIEPFAGKIESGRLYGRGACDIKCGMAAMLAAFARLVREKATGTNVILACTVDEEFTFRGVVELVKRGVKADMAIVAEPTQLDIVHAHKGACRWHLFTTGVSHHSSSPEKGVNALYRMGKVLVGIERFAEHLRTKRNDPVLGPATISVGRIEGGLSVNTVPDRCRIEIDRRVVGGEDPAAAPGELLAFLREHCGLDFPIECDKPWTCKGPLVSNNAAVVQSLGQAIDGVRGQHRVIAVPFGTDASTLAAAGIPTVVFGPGDVAQAHTRDEWVELAQVEAASEILYRFTKG
jgi:acetylornithine deacetylase